MSAEWRRALLNQFDYEEGPEGFDYLMRDSERFASCASVREVADELVNVGLVDGSHKASDVPVMALARELLTAAGGAR